MPSIVSKSSSARFSLCMTVASGCSQRDNAWRAWPFSLCFRRSSMSTAQRFDVIILGAGLAGTTLGTILAKHGYEVLILEKESHPRFAIGESMLPQSTMWLWILGQRFGIPEILYLTDTQLIRQHITPTCGIKRAIGFVYHRQDHEPHPAESHQLIPPALPLYSESHYFRQEVDLYMLRTALHYGVSYRDQVEVTGFDLAEHG